MPRIYIFFTGLPGGHHPSTTLAQANLHKCQGYKVINCLSDLLKLSRILCNTNAGLIWALILVLAINLWHGANK